MRPRPRSGATIRQSYSLSSSCSYYRIIRKIELVQSHLKDDKDRIVTFNRQNPENGNFKDELEVVGKTCAEIFPATVYRTKPCGGAIPDWYDRIKGAVAFIDGHHAEKLTLRQLAESAGLSQALFSRLFKRTMQTTPIRYLTEIRLNHTRKLLAGAEKTLADIAVETGFYDEAHFVRTFKASRGLTPGTHRRTHRQQ